MQPDRHWQEQTFARFMHESRRYLGLLQAPVIIKPPRRIGGRSRQVLRSLVVAGSLGALFGNPAFASEASYQLEPGKRNQNTYNRLKANEPPIHAQRLTAYGRRR